MNPRDIARRWLAGWGDLARHDGLDAYRALGRWRRLRLDLRVMASAPWRPGFLGAVLCLAAAELAAEILVWRHDLAGWRRDVLRCLPVLCVAPLAAAGRRRMLERLLRESECARQPIPDSENPFTDQAPAPSQSERRTPEGAGERGLWNSRALWQHRAGGFRAGWSSSLPSPLSACWRRWRCRGSASSRRRPGAPR